MQRSKAYVCAECCNFPGTDFTSIIINLGSGLLQNSRVLFVAIECKCIKNIYGNIYACIF